MVSKVVSKINQRVKGQQPTTLSSGEWIGIDLGATNTVFGYWINGRVEIHSDNKRKVTMPTIASFEDGGKVTVGNKASNMRSKNEGRVIFQAKSLIEKEKNTSTHKDYAKRWPEM